MRKVEVVEATREHVAALLPHVRRADADEFEAMSGKTPAQVLELALRTSAFALLG